MQRSNKVTVFPLLIAKREYSNKTLENNSWFWQFAYKNQQIRFY